MFIKHFFLTVLVVLAAFAAGCKTGLLGGVETPAAAPQAPPAPIVVDGMRTSYADVVDKTSPAVVRIEADHKEKASPQTQFPGGDDFFRQFQIPKQNQRPQIERGLGSGVV